MSSLQECPRCGRVPEAIEVKQFGGCGCTPIGGALVGPSPYSDDFLVFCPHCKASVITWEDLEGKCSFFLCRCGLSSDFEDRRRDEEFEGLLRRYGVEH
jgi:hypothetical protein